MKTDRELLELAARAVGYQVDTGFADCPLIYGEDARPDGPREWNPLTDDGDALRLAAALDIDVFVNSAYGVVQAESICGDYRGEAVLTEDRADDYRHAILRCAASIGEQMK